MAGVALAKGSRPTCGTQTGTDPEDDGRCKRDEWE